MLCVKKQREEKIRDREKTKGEEKTILLIHIDRMSENQ